jgi:hypothetical protein
MKQQRLQHLLLQQRHLQGRPQALSQQGKLSVYTLASQQWITTSWQAGCS